MHGAGPWYGAHEPSEELPMQSRFRGRIALDIGDAEPDRPGHFCIT